MKAKKPRYTEVVIISTLSPSKLKKFVEKLVDEANASGKEVYSTQRPLKDSGDGQKKH